MTRPLAALLAALVLAGCAPRNAPRLLLPTRTRANCESRSVKQTAIDSIVASVDDTVRPGTYPGDGPLWQQIRVVGGSFAWWPDQRVRMPDTAKALGVGGDLFLTRAVITNEIDRADHYRDIWLTFRTSSGEKTVRERAYDTQDVCIEGQRDV